MTVLVAALVYAGPPALHTGDTGTYARPARELLTHGRFAVNGVPELERTPGYPILLIPGILVGHLEVVTALLQVVMSCALVYLVYRLSRLVFEDERAALFGAALYAVEPLSILYSVKLMSETPFTFLLTLFLIALVAYLKKRSLRVIALAALLLAACAYVRPISYYLPVYLTIVLVILTLTMAAMRRTKYVDILVFALVSMGTLAAWQVRNYSAAGYRGFSAISDVNIYFFEAASVVSAKERTDFHDVWTRFGFWDVETYLAHHPEQRSFTPAQRYVAMRRESLGIIFGSPMVYAAIRVEGMLRTLLNPGGAEYFVLFGVAHEQLGTEIVLDEGVVASALALLRSRPLLFLANVTLFVLLLAFLALAMVPLISRRVMTSPPVILFSAVIAYFLLLSGGAVGSSRFRHPLMPIVAILAGYGLCRLIPSSRTGSAADRLMPPTPTKDAT